MGDIPKKYKAVIYDKPGEVRLPLLNIVTIIDSNRHGTGIDESRRA